MKILLFFCALSVLVMHFNQDLSVIYWISFIAFAITSLLIAKRLDYGRTKNVIELTADINAILAARSRELDRRIAFDKEISEQIKSILKSRKDEKRG